ncbi:MAG TPA: fused MFS/spermidine synthase [Myxococcota bacterium]
MAGGEDGRARAPDREPRGLAAWVYAFAFASAAAALVYQVAWTRLLILTFGRSTLALSAVVAGFMGGMAIGAWSFHRLAAGRSALRVYAALELGIAVFACVLGVTLEGLPGAFAVVAAEVPPGPALHALRFAVVFGLLLPPTACMGATFPALCAVLIRSQPGIAHHLGRIYGLNTLGAAAGALAAGFALIEWLGVRGAVGLAVATNAAIALLAARLTARRRADVSTRAPLPEKPSAPQAGRWLAGTVLFGSGFATLAYEIVWFRALQYLFGNSTYALTLMLVVFLLGLGGGGLLFGRLARRARPVNDLALCQLAIALLALGAIGLEAVVLAEERLASGVSAFSPQAFERAWVLRLALDAALGLVLMLPATLCMGLSFPLATCVLLGEARQVGQRVGQAVLLANAGGILGAALGALVILPLLGTVGGTRAIAGINLALGCALLLREPVAPKRRLAWVLAAGIAFLVSAASLPARLAFHGEGRTLFSDPALIFEEEGDVATVQVWEDSEADGARAMTVDGVVIAVSRGGFYPVYSKQRLLAHLPLLLDGSIARTLSIGLGSGSTLDALASYPTVSQLDAVEISAGVLRASAFFEQSAVLRDPRAHIAVDDAVHHLRRGGERYDLIVADGKQNPDFSSNWVLMSREFYAAASTRLGSDGLFVQWLPLSTLADDFRVALRTFSAVFPEVEVFLNAPHWVILIGSPAPIAGRAAAPVPPGAEADLREFRIDTREALLSYWAADRAALAAEVGDGPLNTWNRSPLEFAATRASAAQRRGAPRENLALLLRADARAQQAGGSPFLPWDSPFLRSTALLRRAHLASLAGRRARARQLAARASEINPADRVARYYRDRL